MSLRRSRRGVAAMEFALTFPPIMMVVAGVLDGCWYLSDSRRLSEAVRSAARVGALVDEDYPATGALIEAAALDTLHDTLVANGFDPTKVQSSAEWIVDDTKTGWLQVTASADHRAFFGTVSPFDRPIAHRFVVLTHEQPELFKTH